MTQKDKLAGLVAEKPGRWLVTGVAGFIGSNLLETLLSLGQEVVGLDNYATGHRHNLDYVRKIVGEQAWKGFRMIEGDIRKPEDCRQACEGVRFVLHQAALGSVPRSIETPLDTNASNVTGFLNMLDAARLAKVSRFVYASSSSVFGDHPDLPKIEANIGNQLSPYAVTKRVNELYAQVYLRCYGLESLGLRYFNIFGPRQDPNGAYAAVIPKFFDALYRGAPVRINGDGQTSRDFCYVDNAVQANLRAALTDHPKAPGKAYNVACGERTTLNELYALIREQVAAIRPQAAAAEPEYGPERAGDVRHSLADIGLARELLGYEPDIMVRQGLDLAARWYHKLACGQA